METTKKTLSEQDWITIIIQHAREINGNKQKGIILIAQLQNDIKNKYGKRYPRAYLKTKVFWALDIIRKNNSKINISCPILEKEQTRRKTTTKSVNLLNLLPINFQPTIRKNGQLFLERSKEYLKQQGWNFYKTGNISREFNGKVLQTGTIIRLDKASPIWLILHAKNPQNEVINLVYNCGISEQPKFNTAAKVVKKHGKTLLDKLEEEKLQEFIETKQLQTANDKLEIESLFAGLEKDLDKMFGN